MVNADGQQLGSRWKYRRLTLPSQFRPPRTTRPAGPTTGPSNTLTPLVLNSPPIPVPLSRASFLFQLAPTWIPLGQVLTKSVPRRPFPASARHIPGKFRRGMAGRNPEQPVFELTPAVKLTCTVRPCCATPAMIMDALLFLPVSYLRPRLLLSAMHHPISLRRPCSLYALVSLILLYLRSSPNSRH